jgi:hypothetical protein
MKLKQLTKHLTLQYRHFAVIGALVMLTACNATDSYNKKGTHTVALNTSLEEPQSNIQRLDMTCYSDVRERESKIGHSGSAAQQLALAKAATRCIENKSFFPQHPDSESAMQLSALAVVNYIKAGETQMAEKSLVGFRQQFPKQDLLFSDYTSFVDTALALLKYKTLSAHELQTLNINTGLRNELKRQQYWLQN